MMQLRRALAMLSVGLGVGCTVKNYYVQPAAPAVEARAQPAASPPAPASPPSSPTAPAAPAPPVSPGSAVPAVPAVPAVIESPDRLPVVTSPMAAHAQGLIVFTQGPRHPDSTMVGGGPVHAIDPVTGVEQLLVPGTHASVLARGSFLSGQEYDASTRGSRFWVLDGSQSLTAQATVPDAVEGFTSDGRLVRRCNDPRGNVFELCTYDRDGSSRRVVYRETQIGNGAFVAGVGGTNVLVQYVDRTPAPFVIDLVTGERREVASLDRGTFAYRATSVSPSGALAVTCFMDDAKATLVVADLTARTPDRTYSLGAGKRCDCKIAPDDRTLACSFLPAAPRWSGKPDRLYSIDLATGRQTVLSDRIYIGDFAFSPDGRQIAAASRAPDANDYSLVVMPVGGGAARTLMPYPVENELVGWIAP